ncbi:MAG: MmcQ/YjbR family DNA-binding protein [Allosphingosinicella sp.]
MASPEDFRRIALSHAGVEESGHMGHPDFRVRGKVFATLGHPDAGWAMVALMPEQQEDFVALAPAAFRPANGAWGRRGSTLVRLDAVASEALEQALAAAWRRRAG